MFSNKQHDACCFRTIKPAMFKAKVQNERIRKSEIPTQRNL